MALSTILTKNLLPVEVGREAHDPKENLLPVNVGAPVFDLKLIGKDAHDHSARVC